jgi:hypothetical protein
MHPIRVHRPSHHHCQLRRPRHGGAPAAGGQNHPRAETGKYSATAVPGLLFGAVHISVGSNSQIWDSNPYEYFGHLRKEDSNPNLNPNSKKICLFEVFSHKKEHSRLLQGVPEIV